MFHSFFISKIWTSLHKRGHHCSISWVWIVQCMDKWENVPKLLDNFGTFIGGTNFGLTRADSRVRFPGLLTNICTPKKKNYGSNHWALFEHFWIVAFFSCTFILWSPKRHLISLWVDVVRWMSDLKRKHMPPCNVERGGEYVHMFLGWNPKRTGYRGQTLNIYTGGYKGTI